MALKTLVLYLGYKHRWDKARTLYEALGDRLPDDLKPFVRDYSLNLFEIAFLAEEDVALFKSDFRFVVDYLVQMRKNRNYKPTLGQIVHVRKVMNALSAISKDARFMDTYIEHKKEG